MTDAVTIREDGTAEMAYTGEVPWHGLGQQMQEGQSTEEWTKAAGFDFEARPSPLWYESTKDHKLQMFPDRIALRRSDNDAPLGILSDKYKVVQPAEVLSYFGELAEKMDVRLSTAGTLFGGRKLWAQAWLAQPEKLVNADDLVRPYLMLATSLDGSMSTIGTIGSVRVVCWNTMRVSFARSRVMKRLRHLSTFRPVEMNEGLGIEAVEQFHGSMELLRSLARVELAPVRAVRMALDLYAPGTDWRDEKVLRRALKRGEIKRLNALVINHDTIGGLMVPQESALEWVNAVTQSTDHGSEREGIEAAFVRAQFGTGAAVKDKAIDMARLFGVQGARPKTDFDVEDSKLLDMAYESVA